MGFQKHHLWMFPMQNFNRSFMQRIAYNCFSENLWFFFAKLTPGPSKLDEVVDPCSGTQGPLPSPILTVQALPTPLVWFCPILLNPPNPPKNRTSFMDLPCHLISSNLNTKTRFFNLDWNLKLIHRDSNDQIRSNKFASSPKWTMVYWCPFTAVHCGIFNVYGTEGLIDEFKMFFFFDQDVCCLVTKLETPQSKGTKKAYLEDFFRQLLRP